MATSPISKDLFIGLEGIAHLFAGGQTPMLRASRDALNDYCDLKAQGMRGGEKIGERYFETRDRLARYLRAPGGADDIALLGTAAEGFNVLAGGIDWRPGDNVVSLKNEYPSSLLPWMTRRKEGVTLTTVEAGEDPEGAIINSITDRTRVVCVSHVNYLTGLRLNLERLATAAHERGVVLAVDASQALGAIVADTEHCDILVSCCYKFQLAAQGVGIFYWNRRRLAELLPAYVGWHSIVDDWQVPPPVPHEDFQLRPSAQRFEIGNPPYMATFVLNEALKVLESMDADAVEAWVLDLGTHLRAGLVKLGLDVWTPQIEAHRGPSIMFGWADCRTLVDRLAARGVYATGSSGRVRLSLHGYNDASDVERTLTALAAELSP